MGADHGERPWWKPSVSQPVSLAAQQHGTAAGVTRGPSRARLAASTRFALLFFNHLPQFRVIGLRFFETNLS